MFPALDSAPEGYLHHLPSRRDHTIYILALALSPIVNLAVRAFKFFWESVAVTNQQMMPPDHWIFSLLSALFGFILVVMVFSLV